MQLVTSVLQRFVGYERLLIGRDPIVGNIALRGAQVEFATANFRAQ
jgi:hypothetical protein